MFAKATERLIRQSLMPWRPTLRTLQRVPLAGFRYHQGERLWARLRPGQPVTLIREPDNPHDPRAVRINWRGHKLGYLPRRDNAAIARLLDRGEALEVRIKALQLSASPWERVALEVWRTTS